MFRSLAKTCYACAYKWSGASHWRSDEHATSMPFILGYHRVVREFEASSRNSIPSMLISVATLERHLDWLARRYQIVSLDEVGLHLEADRPFRRPAAAITFDDGYADVYHHAFPLLKRKGIPAATFVVTGVVDSGEPQVYDRLYLLLKRMQERAGGVTRAVIRSLARIGLACPDLERLPVGRDEVFRVMTILLTRFSQQDIRQFAASLEEAITVDSQEWAKMSPLTWRMISEMSQNGMTIGSHTKSHVLLTSEPSARVKVELVESKRRLETALQQPIRHFAYPDGRFDSESVQAVHDAGYKFAYSICRERDPRGWLLTIPRKTLWERSSMNVLGRFSPAVMHCHSRWVFEGSARCGHDHGTIVPADSGLEPIPLHEPRAGIA